MSGPMLPRPIWQLLLKPDCHVCAGPVPHICRRSLIHLKFKQVWTYVSHHPRLYSRRAGSLGDQTAAKMQKTAGQPVCIYLNRVLLLRRIHVSARSSRRTVPHNRWVSALYSAGYTQSAWKEGRLTATPVIFSRIVNYTL
jgi:hypothetical protein